MICAYYLFIINHPCIITILLNSKKLTVQKFNPIQANFQHEYLINNYVYDINNNDAL